MSLSLRYLALAALTLPLALAGSSARAEETHREFGVYEYVPGSIHDELAAQIKSGLGLP